MLEINYVCIIISLCNITNKPVDSNFDGQEVHISCLNKMSKNLVFKRNLADKGGEVWHSERLENQLLFVLSEGEKNGKI